MNNKIYLIIEKKQNINIDNSISFPNNIEREETKKAYTLLKYMLNKTNNIFNIDDIMYSKNGKPYINNSTIKFNYSHSKNYIACAIATCNIGIDIEDEFNISKEARNLYLKDSLNNYRKEWVKKEAYCKLIEDFNDEYFKNLKVTNKNYYEESTPYYDCILFYESGIKTINKLNYQ